jgi:hypothetical protein
MMALGMLLLLLLLCRSFSSPFSFLSVFFVLLETLQIKYLNAYRETYYQELGRDEVSSREKNFITTFFPHCLPFSSFDNIVDEESSR